MVNVLVVLTLGEPFLERVRAVDPCINATETSDLLRMYIRGEIRDDETMRAAEAEAAAVLPEVDVLVGWGRFPVYALPHVRKLRWIQSVSAGVDRLDKSVVERVVLTNGTGLGAEPIGEHVTMQLLMLARGAREYFFRQQRHAWERGYPVREIAGMTMGIVGMGAIGAAVARRARALGLRVIGIRRSVAQRSPDLVADEVCPPDDLPYLLAESDVVVLATPLTPETRGLIGAEQLRQMRPGSFLINIARGAVVDEPALIEALRDGHLGGAALDVVQSEPLSPESPLWDMPNVIITPHVATGSDKYLDRVSELVCDNLRRYLDGRPLRNLIDTARGY
jgi:D-2-hydroxyacid dehydrogenase (NADP+)